MNPQHKKKPGKNGTGTFGTSQVTKNLLKEMKQAIQVDYLGTKLLFNQEH